MKIDNGPRKMSLEPEELKEAIVDWLRKTYPDIVLCAIDGGVDFLGEGSINPPTFTGTDMPIIPTAAAEEVSDEPEQLIASPTKEEPVKATRKSARKLNVGIGKVLTVITGDYRKHHEKDIYAKLKPDFPHLKYASLHLNLYNVDGLEHLGNGTWCLPKRPALGSIGSSPQAEA